MEYVSRVRTLVAAGAVVAALIGCSSKDASSNQNQSAGTDATAPASAAAEGSPVADAGASDVPIYPGAVRKDVKAPQSVGMCGHKLSISSYQTATDAKTVIAWYEDHVSGGKLIDVNSDADNTSVEVLAPGGAEAAVIMQMHFENSKLQNAAKMIDANKTSIGIEKFDPPLGQDFVDLSLAATGKDPAAAAAAKAKLGTMCPNP